MVGRGLFHFKIILKETVFLDQYFPVSKRILWNGIWLKKSLNFVNKTFRKRLNSIVELLYESCFRALGTRD